MSITKQRIIKPFDDEQVIWNSGLLPYKDKFLMLGNTDNHDIKKYAFIDQTSFETVSPVRSFVSKKNFDFRTINYHDKTWAIFFTKQASHRSGVVLQSFNIQPDLSIKWEANRNLLEPIDSWPGGYNKTRAEKNWMPFVYNEELYFVYTLSPHIVLRFNEFTKRVQRVYDSSANFSYKAPTPVGDFTGWYPDKFGLSGNSNCVRVGDYYLNLFHCKPTRNYWTGYYFFEAKPPFRPVLLGTVPLLEPSDCTEGRKSARVQRCFDNVQFPIGLHVAGPNVLVSYGVNDCLNSIAEVSIADLLKNTVKI
jgi:predicted GH43/DUF377 family glycosyl hydrolase